MKIKTTITYVFLLMLMSIVANAQRTFVHPGLMHKTSDLERMKYMVEAGKDPWITTYRMMLGNSSASYDFNVNGSPDNTSLEGFGAFREDGIAAYYNALMWQITGDERHAQKSVEIFNAWVNITSISSTLPLDAGRVIWKMMEGAEIIKSTYSGWSEEDIAKFEAMLVYPGYSTTVEPTAALSSKNVTFYWTMYNGDPARHGNQGLFAFRGIMAMGIFMDNEIMYDRALRYLKGEYVDGKIHRDDDLPYPSGPPVLVPQTTGNIYYTEFSQVSRGTEIVDYGYNEVMSNYIYENGQGQESSRDQAHGLGGVSIITAMCEMAWSQGDDLYGHLDNRPLLGMEFYFRYNLTYDNFYPDQLTPWEPTVESGEYIERSDRSGRWFALRINPFVGNNLTEDDFNRGKHNLNGVYEMNLGHYKDRMQVDDSKTKWLQRGFDLLTETIGVENQDNAVDHPGWGGIKFRRVSPGDPISGFDSGELPVYAMHVLPGTIESEDFDYFVLDGEGRTYHDLSGGNTSTEYRTDDDVDITTSSEGDYSITGIESGEWVVYTVAVEEGGTFDISVKYASTSGDGTINLLFDDEEIGAVNVPFGSPNSTGLTDWQDFTLANDLELEAGVYEMKVMFGGTSESFDLNSIDFEQTSIIIPCEDAITLPEDVVSGVNYSYYEGTWDNIPNFDVEQIVKNGLASSFDLTPALLEDFFAMKFDAYFEVTTEGDHTFYTTSDDGSNLYVDDELIVFNDGKHGEEEASGTVCLDQGTHALRVEYFEATGGNFLEVMWEGADFAKTSISELYTVSKLSQTIVFDALPSKVITDVDFTIEATVSTGLDIVYSSSDTDVATVVDGSVHIVGAGTTTITASQLGDEEYYSIDASQTLVVDKLSQTISFEDFPEKVEKGASLVFEATASSGLPVSYTSSNTEAVLLLNGDIYILETGVSTITASQEGDSMYDAAEEVMQILTVEEEATVLNSEDDLKSILLSPNPVINTLNIQFNVNEYSEYGVYNINGKVMKSGKVLTGSKEMEIELDHLSKGMYLLKLQGSQATRAFKVIKN